METLSTKQRKCIFRKIPFKDAILFNFIVSISHNTKVFSSFFHVSCSLEQLDRLLRAGIDVSVTDTNTTKNTPLHWAASFGNAITVQLLLEQFGADPNVTNSQGMTPLHDAVLRKDIEIVKVLIKFGANPTIKNSKDDKSPIDQASDKEDLLQVLKTSSYLHNNEIKPVVNGIKETETDDQEHPDESNNFQEVSSVTSFPP